MNMVNRKKYVLTRLVPVVEQLGRAHVMSTWKLDPVSLKFFLKGTLITLD